MDFHPNIMWENLDLFISRIQSLLVIIPLDMKALPSNYINKSEIHNHNQPFYF